MQMRIVSLIPLFFALPTLAQEVKKDTVDNKRLSEVTVTAKLNIYKVDSSSTVSKLPLKDLENPQVYNTISKTVIKDQVITNLNNALKNVTGITRLWESTGRGGDGAEFYSMRGFAVQPTMINGMPNISNGTMDPANIETIEVIKGPSGTLYGSSLISYGGLINIVTKQPYEIFGGEVGFVAGSYGLSRFTADINTPLDKNAFARVNAAYHYENSFQNAGLNKSFYIAPSFKIKASEKLTFLINTEFKNTESANAPMVFLSRYSSLSFNKIDLFEKNYKNSYTNNSLSIKTPNFNLQAQALYKLSSSWVSQTMLSKSHTKSDGYYHYLWDAANGNEFTRFIAKQAGETGTTDIQQNFIGEFNIGNLKNKMVAGVDYLHSLITANGSGWVANGKVSLANQTDSGILTPQGVDALLAKSASGSSVAKTEIISAYISDVLYLTPQLSAMLSLRIDNFSGKPLWSNEEIKSQTSLSPKFGLVYQPVLNKLSIFANYMNGFTNLSPSVVSDTDGTNPHIKIFEPEQANQWELGAKASLFNDKISVTASYYNILVSNRTMPDPKNVKNTIQGGEVASKGFELSVVTNPIEGLSIIAGFSHNDNKVTKDATDGGYLGLRTEEAGPADLFNFWAMYRVQNAALKGLSIGFGGNSASKHKTLNRSTTGVFALPAYSVYNALLSYTSNNYSINLKLDNVANTKYYSGWSTVTPQRLRSISLGASFRF